MQGYENSVVSSEKHKAESHGTSKHVKVSFLFYWMVVLRALLLSWNVYDPICIADLRGGR
jgi:hypothetical protein